jgi:hypothetical protein
MLPELSLDTALLRALPFLSGSSEDTDLHIQVLLRIFGDLGYQVANLCDGSIHVLI